MKKTPTSGPTSVSSSRPQNGPPHGHRSVLYQAVLESLSIRPGGLYVDATVGAGGHAAGILEAAAPDGRLLGLDRDAEAISFAMQRLAPFGNRVTLIQAPFDQLSALAPAAGFQAVDGILFDLGFSSRQLDDPQRGFSFMHDGPLDMRLDLSQSETAADLVNYLDETELANLIYRYGEEPASRRIARAIVASRPLQSTGQLAQVIRQAVGRRARRETIHPATRTFQALRIATNHELEQLEESLPHAVQLLRPGGRLAVIAFHSLEDRIVKQYFKQETQDCLCPPSLPVCACNHRASLKNITRKPIRPSAEEIAINSRSHSARLRVAERLSDS